MSDAALTELAWAAGLLPKWTNASGNELFVSPETMRVVLETLKLPASTPADISESRERLEKSKRELPHLLVARAGDKLALGAVRHAAIHFDDGTVDVPRIVRENQDDASITVPSTIGYHRIETDLYTRPLAIAPRHCFSIADIAAGRRLGGLAVQLYSLRGGHTAGFGDLAALSDFAMQAASFGIDAIAISPLHALFWARPEDFSPYSPSTRFFLNSLYADTAFAGGPIATDDNAIGLVDWSQAAGEKKAALRQAFARFKEAEPPADFTAFCKEQGTRLIRHALFETLDAHFRSQGMTDWRAWPKPFQDPDSIAVRKFADEHSDTVAFHVFLQWLSVKSLATTQQRARDAGMAVGLIADIAIGMNPNGSHAWSAPAEILMNLSVGAPPDVFNPQGQNWGLTALSPTALKETGYSAFISTLRAGMRDVGGVRIDHALGLRRLWVVPQAADSSEGVYLSYPMDDLLNLLSLESFRHRAIVIGEDLGSVPEGLRDELAQRRVMGMEVLWFQKHWRDFLPPHRWTKHSVALTSTHDLPTVAGWWRGRDIDWLEKLGRQSSYGDAAAERAARAEDRGHLWTAVTNEGCAHGPVPAADDPEPAVDAIADFIGQTPCELGIVQVEDILALPEQPNIPGTIDEHPNWRRRLPPGDTFEAPQARRTLEIFRQARAKA